MSDQEDTIQLNTINQNEYSIKLAKQKKKFNEKKMIKTNKKINREGSSSKNKDEKKKLLTKKKKKADFKVAKRTNDVSTNINSKLLNENKEFDDESKQFDTTKAHENDANDENQKFTKLKFNKKRNDDNSFHHGSSKSTPKAAKFSSLFKNNHEIPNVGDIEAKSEVKECLFSKNSFSKLDLAPHLIDCLQKRFKLEQMTQIQEKTIPAILNGKDCFVKSQTGSGKTLAYAIPIIQKLQALVPKLKRSDGIKALVLVPTRELAIQTCQVFEQLCNACVWIVPGCLIGGMKKKSEKDRIRRGLNVLIATPGRLCDHLDTTMALDLGKLDYLIFDEADRMLDMDFEKKINFIIFKIHSAKKKVLSEPEVPKYKLDLNGEPIEDGTAKFNGSNDSLLKRIDPQTILISATLTNGIKEIARRLNINDALHIDAQLSTKKSKNDTNNNDEEEKIALPAGLTHYYMVTPSKLRLIVLISFILDKFIYQPKSNTKKLIIFASTNDSVQFHENILETFLNRKFNMYLEDDHNNDYDEFDSDIDELKSKFKVDKEKSRNSCENKVCDLFSLYGNMDQHKRAEILSKFCKVSSGVLICTDVAARGLDMPNIDWIIQYNTPGTSVDYIHRVGRTARVGHKGKALIFLEPCEIEYLKELNRLNISLHEIKLDSVMDCLNEEAKYYPRQVNSERLVFGRNAEECANSMQFYIEEYVENKSEVQSMARKAYLSFLRSYSCYNNELKKVFHLKNLHIGHVAKSFGLREAPKQIHGNDIKMFQTNKFKNKENGNEYDPLKSKYTRDLKRISNGHREYGNVMKKNKLKSQKAIDLSGLLKNHSDISEYASGLEKSGKNSKKRPFSKISSASAPDIKSDNIIKPESIKKIKRNMDIFD